MKMGRDWPVNRVIYSSGMVHMPKLMIGNSKNSGVQRMKVMGKDCDFGH
jgi:hypothetical protein